MRAIHDTEFPNSVDATQKLLNEQGREYERLKVCVLILLCVCNDDLSRTFRVYHTYLTTLRM